MTSSPSRTESLSPDLPAAEVAALLGVSTEAVALAHEAELFDLHLDSFIWTRLFGYDLRRRHGRGLLGRRVFHHSDIPRLRAAGVGGATWVITTNPFRTAGSRRRTFHANYERLQQILTEEPTVELVRDAAEYRAARANGSHAAFLGIQGGNAIDLDVSDVEALAGGPLLRITLVHLTSSDVGATSFPLGRAMGTRRGLGPVGRDYVRACNAARIAVDLAHIEEQAFFDAVEVHDPSRPLWITHTGVEGVYRHWRNASDRMLRAVADTGGIVGIMFEQSFLGARDVTVETVVDHIEHVVDTVGEDVAAIGSDYDGAITPPPDLPSVLSYPRLVQAMMNRGWSGTRIEKILGENVLRSIARLRP